MTTLEVVSDDDLFVSPDGDDDWSGERPDPNDAGSDGPFETIERAQRAVRERRDGAEPLPDTVWLRGGRYPVEEPLVFGPEDSIPVTYAAYPGEEPVVSGGRRLDGWEDTTVNGVDAWKTTVPEVADGEWYFRQLIVDGQRRQRPRLPEDGYYRVTDVPYEREELWNTDGGVSYSFTAADADLPDPYNRSDVDVLVPHRWVQERSPLADIDPDSGRVEMAFYAKMWLESGERVAFENVFEALSDPGEWYLDRETGECYYVPEADERPETVSVYAPVPTQLLRVEGKPERGESVEFLDFEGITFRHAAWSYPSEIDADRLQAPFHDLSGDDDAATSVQAQYVVPGAVSLSGARNCRVSECTVEHVGLYGLQLARGCRGNRVVGNDLRDLGAGGVKVEGEGVDGPRAGRTGNNRIADNHIQAGGRVFPAGVGILARHTDGTELAHNHVHDFYYSGVSCGWSWGYGECVERDNHIEYNHIHDIGHGLLSDMGGIYTLGVQPGTTVRGNHIHDVAAYDYGGWGIYPDEGSSHIVVEDNLVHDTNRQAFHQHYGRENVVRNNVFAFGNEGQIQLSRTEDGHRPGFTFERNVVVTDDEPLFLGGYGSDLEADELITDLNLVWDVANDEPTFAATNRDPESRETIDRETWTARGNDRHSIVAAVDVEGLADRTLGELGDGSPDDVGFEPPDLSDVDPRT